MTSSPGRHARPRAKSTRRAAVTGALGAAATLSAIATAGVAQAAAPAPGGAPLAGRPAHSPEVPVSRAAAEQALPVRSSSAAAGPASLAYVIGPGEHVDLASNPYTPVTHPFGPFPVMVARTAATTQVITVKAAGSYATVTLWQKTSATWHQVATTTAARIGSHGLTDGVTRHQGTYTTPLGTYTITQGFGVGADPGTKMPYHQVTTHDWWVEDPTSAYYNQMRTDTQGGFHLTEAGDDGSEHLINYPTQYHNALVINYNTNPAVKGRGAGIFLHDLGPQAGPTAGCVAVPATFMTQVMQWIDPSAHPVIAIG